MLLQFRNNFQLRSGAILSAAHYLAPNSKRKGLLTGVRSLNRQQALHSVKRASWDLTLINEFVKRVEKQKEDNSITVLCTYDQGLKRILRSLIDSSTSNQRESNTIKTLQELWGESFGTFICEQIIHFQNNKDNPNRQINKPTEPNFIDKLVFEGEKFVLNWHP